MSKQFKGILYYLTLDYRFSFMMFWSILLASITVLLIITMSLNDTQITFSSALSIYIYSGISGFLLTKETFPYCVKLGSTRNNYILGTIFFSVFLAITMSFVHMIALSIFELVISLNNIENISIFLMVQNETFLSTLLEQFLVDSVICFLVLSLGFLLGTAFYRLGMIGGLSGVAILAIMIILPQVRTWLFDTFIQSSAGSFQLNYVALILLALIAMIPNWLLLKKAPTTPGVTR
ncbi:hypothetical protein [Bacillus sp. PS06]|uniref:hypothetical protein n=1 Tax=Bacillus sp. PS06 TaxID=2764176 RepID=UPI001786D55F|nr:hypothetical protein [Bacillus sp. PS06]MBD8069479.1 hypothetical protein [Bacillus sp. PS06]